MMRVPTLGSELRMTHAHTHDTLLISTGLPPCCIEVLTPQLLRESDRSLILAIKEPSKCLETEQPPKGIIVSANLRVFKARLTVPNGLLVP